MATYNRKTEDQFGRQIKPVAVNTAKDGSGTWLIPLADADGNLLTVGGGSDTGVYTTPTHAAPSIGATTTVALAANANRLYTLFENDSDETIYLKLGAAAVLNQGIRLNAHGGSYEMSKKLGNLYLGAVNGICASGSKVCLVCEGV